MWPAPPWDRIHLTLNIGNYYGNMTPHELAVELADHIANRLESLRFDEASGARVLRELLKNQRLAETGIRQWRPPSS